MIQTTDSGALYRMRTLRKDIGVAVVVLLALALGWLLRAQTEGRVKLFQDANSPFRIAYPTSWGVSDSLQDVLLKVADPQTDSTFKTNLTVESREIDPASPLDLQTLLDRRVEQRGALTGYHFLSNTETTVAGVNSAVFEYACGCRSPPTRRSSKRRQAQAPARRIGGNAQERRHPLHLAISGGARRWPGDLQEQ